MKKRIRYTAKQFTSDTDITYIPVDIKPRNYVYTEEDLGEGLLEAGLEVSYFISPLSFHNENVQAGQPFGVLHV